MTVSAEVAEVMKRVRQRTVLNVQVKAKQTPQLRCSSGMPWWKVSKPETGVWS